MENAGTNLPQVFIGVSICLASVLTLYYIPSAIIDLEIKEAFFYLNLLLVGCVLGIVFICQSAALFLCKFFVDVIFLLVPGDRKLKPLIVKNLESHSLKNLNANLLYCVTICFLIFQASNFLSINLYLNQMGAAIFGGDIALYGIDKFAQPKFEELKLRTILEKFESEEFNLITSYSFNSSPLKRQF